MLGGLVMAAGHIKRGSLQESPGEGRLGSMDARRVSVAVPGYKPAWSAPNNGGTPNAQVSQSPLSPSGGKEGPGQDKSSKDPPEAQQDVGPTTQNKEETRPKRSYLSSKRRDEVQRWLGSIQPAKGFVCRCTQPEPWTPAGFGWRELPSEVLTCTSLPVTPSPPPLPAISSISLEDNDTRRETKHSLLRSRLTRFFKRSKSRLDLERNPTDSEGSPNALNAEMEEQEDLEKRPYCMSCGLPVHNMITYPISADGDNDSERDRDDTVNAGTEQDNTGAQESGNRSKGKDTQAMQTVPTQLAAEEIATTVVGADSANPVVGDDRSIAKEEGDDDFDDDDESGDPRKPKITLDDRTARLRRAEKLLARNNANASNDNNNDNDNNPPEPTASKTRSSTGLGKSVSKLLK